MYRMRRQGQNMWKPVATQKSLSNSVSQNDRLIMPEDEFWLLRRYRKKFGDPKSKENKARGHKVCRKHGLKGVVVPGDDGEGPFRLQRSLQNSLSLRSLSLASDFYVATICSSNHGVLHSHVPIVPSFRQGIQHTELGVLQVNLLSDLRDVIFGNDSVVGLRIIGCTFQSGGSSLCDCNINLKGE